MNIINLTGTHVFLHGEHSFFELPASDKVARLVIRRERKNEDWLRFQAIHRGVSTREDRIKILAEHQTRIIEDLPDPVPGTLYLVANDVFNAIEGRSDVLTADTFTSVERDVNDVVCAITRLIRKCDPVVCVGEYEPTLIAFDSK